MPRAFPTTIRECERFLLDLAGRSDSVPLQVPTRAKYLGPANEASITQLIITWANHQLRPVLRTYATDGDDEQIDDLLRRQYGLVAALLCTSIRARTPSIDITGPVKDLAAVRLARKLSDPVDHDGSRDRRAMASDERSARGRAAELLCVDHMEVGVTPPFYYVDSKGYRNLRDLRGFTQLTNRVFDRLIPSYYRRNFDQEFKNAIGAFAFELISNTHDHARTDLQGHELLKSVRGMQARHYELADDTYRAMARGFEPLETYLAEILAHPKASREKLIELSVFDSGPGMAQRWTNKPLNELSENDEVQAVQECFFEGTTTKLHRMFGAGLPLVLSLLRRRHGFIRVRTGRLSLHLSLPSGDMQSKATLARWTLPTAKSLAPVVGTLITILVPVPRVNE